MSLVDLASIGSFVSGIAVVFSFLFLSLQLRQANRNQRSLMQQGRSTRTVDVLMRMTDPALMGTITKALEPATLLEPAQLFTFYGYSAALFWNYEDSFLQHQAGTLDAAGWATDVSTMKRLLTMPAYRASWRIMRDSMGDAYRNFVDSIMDDVRGTSRPYALELWNNTSLRNLTALQ